MEFPPCVREYQACIDSTERESGRGLLYFLSCELRWNGMDGWFFESDWKIGKGTTLFYAYITNVSFARNEFRYTLVLSAAVMYTCVCDG